MNSNEYWTEVRSIAANLVAEELADADGDQGQAEEEINDHSLHEAIDNHQWVIYYSYNLDVLKHSDNANYMLDQFGAETAEESLRQGLDTLHCHLAFWALYADVQGALEAAFEASTESKMTA